MARYCATKGRWRHGPRIRIHYGYRVFSDPGVAFRLHRFLYALCWTGTDRPSALFDAAATWLLEFKEIGRASCRERVGKYVWIWAVAVSLKKKQPTRK